MPGYEYLGNPDILKPILFMHPRKYEITKFTGPSASTVQSPLLNIVNTSYLAILLVDWGPTCYKHGKEHPR